MSRRRVREEPESPRGSDKLKRGPGAMRLGNDHSSEEESSGTDSVFRPSKAAKGAEGLESGKTYTAKQVKAIVAGAVRDREAELREEYDNILAERLDDQWRTFSKFNEAQLHSQLERSTHDYYC